MNPDFLSAKGIRSGSVDMHQEETTFVRTSSMLAGAAKRACSTLEINTRSCC